MLDNLLGRYSQEEQEFILEMKKSRVKRVLSTESRGGMMRVGRKMDPELNFLPTSEEMDEYISNSLRSIFGNAE